MILAFSTAQAKELVVTLNGNEVKINYSMINHEIKEADKGKGDQASAMTCSFLVYKHLANGDIQGMAKLSAEPAKSLDKWTKYRERVGVEYFNKIMSDYFTSRNIVLAELVLAEETMLIIKTDDGLAGQFYQKRDGKYLMIDMPKAGKTFGRILGMIKEDKLTL